MICLQFPKVEYLSCNRVSWLQNRKPKFLILIIKYKTYIHDTVNSNPYRLAQLTKNITC